MVLAVQSDFTEFESHMACNGKPIYWNMRNPLRSTLLATAQHLFGLLPSHLSYSEANQRTEQNWLWSVGDNALSYTSMWHHFSNLHIDIAHRNQIVMALYNSKRLLNQAITILHEIQIPENIIGKDLERVLLPLSNLTKLYKEIKRTWNETINEIASKRYDNATKYLNRMLKKASSFKKNYKVYKSDCR